MANTLIVVVSVEGGTAAKNLSDFATDDVRRIAIGEPASAPVAE